MSLRITVMIDKDLDKKIREKQIKTMQKTNKNYSYSQALNDSLREKL